MKPAKNVLPDRDPRCEPQPGDVLVTPDGRERRVTTLLSKGRYVDYVGTTHSGRVTIAAWQHWCKSSKAQVKR